MKRIFSMVLCIALLIALPVAGFADVDLSAMSYDELVALKDRINLAMWECEEWQEVEVPQGIWQVGVDIPAGHWTIIASDGSGYCSVQIGRELDKTGKGVEDYFDYGYANLVSSSNSYFEKNTGIESIDFYLVDGEYVVIEGATVIFTPYQGKPSLDFKTKLQSEAASSSDTDEAIADNSDIPSTKNEYTENEAAEITTGQKNALKTAQNYLSVMPFSYKGLIEQLEYEQYSYEDAVYAADNCGADWNEQAMKKAKQYMDIMAFSRDGLIQQLEFEGFTHEQAVYGAEANGY